MLKITSLAFAISIFLNSCVSQDVHDKVISQNDSLKKEIDTYKQELDEIKFGAPNLLADAIKFYDANDFTQSRQKFQMLIDRHPDMPQSIEAKKYLNSIDEEELWNNALNSEDISISESYIARFPAGRYITIANNRLEELKKLNMQKSYDFAKTQNTSDAWKKFLEDYPNYIEAAAIRKQIIRLEVEEISHAKGTGQMPTFEQSGSGNSTNSTVRIQNNTGCDLTVRYSGPDVEMIVIPVNGTRSVHLSSGIYNITASACGEDYAGIETLQGEYSSVFYITTTRY